jgi:lincosamide nucleotidyltransferase A/C/D/E
MRLEDVLIVLDRLSAAGCRVWVGGGWGVDALVGTQTRPHRDLDLALSADDEERALAALAELGYVIETDWRPVRLECAAAGGRWVDLHPVVFDESGNGVQADVDGGIFRYPAACFVTGTIGGRRVGCLSAEQQVIFHSGYPPRDIDRADLALLERLVGGN